MIYYVATAEFTHTMRTFQEHWAGDVAQRIRVMTYDQLLRAEALPLGTYVFSDMERLLPSETEIAVLVWDQLHRAGARILNHPTRTLRRYDLLAKLHALGRNRFRVVRAADRTTELHFPVFFREEGEHGGSLSDLITGRRKLDEALAGAVIRGHRLKHLLVIEYCNTVDKDGIFRKYAAFMVGGRVVPCHIDCSKGWVVKDTDLVSREIVDAERVYLETNPHRAWLEETFALAGVDYGRVDYSLLDGTPQVWEINTNPIVALHPENYTDIHMPVKRRFVDLIRPAFVAIDTEPSPRATVRIDVPIPFFTRLDFDKRRQHWAHMHRTAFRRALTWAPVRGARRLVRPLLGTISPLLTRSRRSDS